MRVLSLFRNLSHGGAEMRTLDRQRTPELADFDHHIACFTNEPGPLDGAFEALGVTLHRCALDRGFAPRFHRLLRRLRPDVVHANQQWPSAVFLAQAHAAGVPGRVAQFHASNDLVEETPARHWRNRFLRRLMRQEATAITGVSEGVLDALWRPDWRSDPRFSVEYLGIDLARFDAAPDRAGVRAELGLPADTPLVLHVGNMAPPKNHPGLGRIFAHLAQQHPTVALATVGRRDPAFEQPMRAPCREAGVEDRLKVLGPRDDVARLLRAADAFLFPSVNEGLPTVVLEARAAGLPVVATDLTGTLEIGRVLPRVTCLSLDAPAQAWTDALLAALDGPLDDLSAGNPLADSPFENRRSAAAHAALWRRSVGR